MMSGFHVFFFGEYVKKKLTPAVWAEFRILFERILKGDPVASESAATEEGKGCMRSNASKQETASSRGGGLLLYNGRIALCQILRAFVLKQFGTANG